MVESLNNRDPESFRRTRLWRNRDPLPLTSTGRDWVKPRKPSKQPVSARDLNQALPECSYWRRCNWKLHISGQWPFHVFMLLAAS